MALIIPDGDSNVTIDGPGNIPTGSFTTGQGKTLLANALNDAFIIAAVLVLFYLIWAGIQWIMSGGDKQKVAASRNRLIYSIIGLVIIALAIPIINLILEFFGGGAHLGNGV